MKISQLETIGLHAEAIGRGWTEASGAEAVLAYPPLEMVNGDVGALVEGDVVVIDTDGQIIKTTTAQDTRKVGVVLDDIAIGESGPVAFDGPVDLIRVTASVTAGEFAETSTTAGLASASATQRAGSFGIFTSTGASPSGFLFGGAPSSSSAGAGLPWYNVVEYGATGDGTTDDRVACQAAATAAAAAGGGILYFPEGSYKITTPGLTVGENVHMVGDGRENTFLLAGTNSINIVTITGTAADSTFEQDHYGTVRGIEFGANGKTGCIGLSFIGVTYFDVYGCTFRGFSIGSEYFGSLQGRFDNCKFLSNTRGIKYSQQNVTYATLPPNRVLVNWCTFYYNTTHAIDWSGGQQIIIADSEFGDNGTVGDAATAAIKVRMAGDNGGYGLVARGLWIEQNHGLAALDLGGTVIGIHTLADCWLAYGDSTYSIALDGSTAAQTLSAFNVRHDQIASPSTVSTWRSVGGTTYLHATECDGSLSGTWTVTQFDGTTWSGAFGPPSSTNIWRPLISGGAVITDGSGQAVMAYGPA